MRFNANLLLLPSLLLLNGCWFTGLYLWAPYKKPTTADFRQSSAQPGCPRVGVQNLGNRQEAAVLDAVAEVCRIFRSDEFARQVRARSWLASCDRQDGREDRVEGASVAALLQGPIEDFSVIDRKPLFAEGQIDPPNARIAIRKWRVNGWRSNDPHRRKWLVETVAHEMSHFVREPGGSSFRFRDGGHTEDKPGCPDKDLVSYGVGWIVRDIWIAEQISRPRS